MSALRNRQAMVGHCPGERVAAFDDVQAAHLAIHRLASGGEIAGMFYRRGMIAE